MSAIADIYVQIAKIRGVFIFFEILGTNINILEILSDIQIEII